MIPSKLFITGTTGFIGSNLVDRLVNDRYSIVALARPSSDLRFIKKHIESGRVEIKMGDIRAKDELPYLMEGCDSLVHCASFVGDWGVKEDYYQTNVGGTRNLLESARKCGIGFTLLISSNAVLGEEDCKELKPEEAPYNPRFPYFLSRILESDMNHYRVSKMLAERDAISFSEHNGLHLTVVRPVWVYGPREFNAGPYIFCKSILSGNRFFPGSKKNRFHTIYVEDLSEVIARLIEKRKQGVNIFNVGSEHASNMNEFWCTFCDTLGKEHPIYLPLSLTYPIGFALEGLYKLFKSKNAPLLTRARVEMGYCNNVYDVRKIREELGPLRETSLKEGVEKTVRWWKENGYL